MYKLMHRNSVDLHVNPGVLEHFTTTTVIKVNVMFPARPCGAEQYCGLSSFTYNNVKL